MGKSLDEIMNSLPEERRNHIEARGQQLLNEYLTLRDLRKAQALTQKKVAELLNMPQGGVSRLEKRSDMLLSTLREYVRAMGGELKLVAEFPDRTPVVLTCVGDTSGIRNE